MVNQVKQVQQHLVNKLDQYKANADGKSKEFTEYKNN